MVLFYHERPLFVWHLESNSSLDCSTERGLSTSDLQDSADTMIAYAYIWGNVDDPDLYGEWDFDVSISLHANRVIVSIFRLLNERQTNIATI